MSVAKAETRARPLLRRHLIQTYEVRTNDIAGLGIGRCATQPNNECYPLFYCFILCVEAIRQVQLKLSRIFDSIFGFGLHFVLVLQRVRERGLFVAFHFILQQW